MDRRILSATAAMVVATFGAVGTAHAECWTHCTDCTVRLLTPGSDGGAHVDFDGPITEETTCDVSGDLYIDPADRGAPQLYAGLLEALMSNKRLEAVRACGCITLGSSTKPKLAWFKIRRER